MLQRVSSSWVLLWTFFMCLFSPDFVAKAALQILHFDTPEWYSALWTLRESLLIIALSQTLHTLASFASNLDDPGQTLYFILFWWRLKLNLFVNINPQTSQLRVLLSFVSLFWCFSSWCLFKLYFDPHWTQQTSQFRVFFLKEVNDKNVSNQKGLLLPWSVLCRSNGRHAGNEMQRSGSKY